LKDAIEILEEGSKHLIVESMNGHFGVVDEALLDGRLEEEVGAAQSLCRAAEFFV